MADWQPNPLRPYYVPPAAGDAAAAATSAVNATATARIPSAANNLKAPTASAFAFPDLDYSDYLPEASPSVASSIRTLVDQAIWKYATVLTAQPLEVAKLILQVRVAGDDDDGEYGEKEDRPDEFYNDDSASRSEDDDDEEPNFFTSTPIRPSPQPRGRRRQREHQQQQQSTGSASGAARGAGGSSRIALKNSSSLLDALSSLSSSTGVFSMWRGTNATLIYSVLSRTLEPFLRSFLAALAGVAEPELILPLSSASAVSAPATATAAALADSSTSLIIISTAACALTSLLLAPIDTARTRLILTAQEPRSLLAVVRTLSPAWLIPSHLVPITLISSTLPSLVTHTSPLFFRSYLGLDPVTTPASWSIATLAASAVDLGLKLPLETVLRRAQIATWTSSSASSSSATTTLTTTSQRDRKLKQKEAPLDTVVRVPQSYDGIVSTMWTIVREEGYSESQKDRLAHLAGRAPRRRRRGQGIEGLYRGWRVGVWGLVGVWGTSFAGLSSSPSSSGGGGSNNSGF